MVFFITAVLIATIHLRTISNRIFYRYRASVVARENIKQQLWKKQVRLESMVNPAYVINRFQDQSGE